MNLTSIEKETIIVFNEAESEAAVQTYNGKLTRRLEQLERDRPDEVSRDHQGDYVIPKTWIKINPTRIMTDEQREQLAERARERFLAQNPK